MCSGDCRTFLWGGEGVPTHNGGQCSCVCQNSSWSNLNLLGRPSCVPVKAHQIFGWAGLAASLISLAHVMYHLRRQLKFHAQQPAAASSPVEKCRLDMHFYFILSVMTFICYLSMVLGGALRWSVVVLCCTQIPTSIGGILALRMWISTNDPRLLRDSPELLAVSNWIQTSTGKIVGYSFPNIHGGVAAAVAIAGYTETSVKFLATGDGCLGVAFAVFFWYIGKFLLSAIDTSLARNTGGGEGSGGALLAARKKVVKIISFFVQQCVMGSIMVLFSAHSKYGTEAPLLLFCLPFVLPVQMSMVCTQLFTGRSKLRSTSVGNATSGGRSGITSRSGLVRKRTANRSHHHDVVPTETTLFTVEHGTTGGTVGEVVVPLPPLSVLPGEASIAPTELSVAEDPVVPFEMGLGSNV